MDEFSWFVGLYEGEGSAGSRRHKKRYKDWTYYNGGLVLTIKMTDEDIIARAAKFLGVSYKPVGNYHHLSKKQQYQVRVMGGREGKLAKLYQRMLPHLSKRRQEQIKGHIDRANDWGSERVRNSD
jgi:hypothetical protein